LGFIPFDLPYDAVELSGHGDRDKILSQHPYLKDKTFIRSSDAHIPDRIGVDTCYFELETRSFAEIRMALHGEQGRRVWLAKPE
ncbi:MAG: hypothetical protein J6X35_03895, partial [Bacteroidales bacterium]|nr:hypothetical protein [Bacteroidales bacterium]